MLKPEGISAWFYFGDFNEIVYQIKQVRGNLRPQWKMDAFKDALESCYLSSLSRNSLEYTWSNNRQGDAFAKEKLDRTLANPKGIACNTKYLSNAGKEILIRVVLQAIPSYTMSIFILPKYIATKLNYMISKF